MDGADETAPLAPGTPLCAYCARADEPTKATDVSGWCARCERRRTYRVVAGVPAASPAPKDLSGYAFTEADLRAAGYKIEERPAPAAPPPPGPGLPARGPVRFGPKSR